MRTPLCATGLLLSLTFVGCAPAEPAVTPLSPAAPEAPPLALAPPPAPPEAPAPPPELTPEQAVSFYKECWQAFNSKDFEKLATCYSEAAVAEWVDSGMPPLTGKDIVEGQAKPFATAFPDATANAQLILANGNNVVGIWLLKGTHQGTLLSPTGELAPTQRKIGYFTGHVVEIHGGKASREQRFSDMRTLLGQIGVVPGAVRKVVDSASPEPSVIIASGSSTESANLETYGKYVAAFNKHDVKEVEALLAEDFVFSDQSAPSDLVGKKEVQRGIRDLWKGMSDVRFEPKSVWAAGDYVVSTSTFSGTNDGPIPSMKIWKKTGKSVSVQCLELLKMENGRLKQHWLFANGMAFAAQLGLLPPAKESKPVASAPAAQAKPSGAAAAPSR